MTTFLDLPNEMLLEIASRLNDKERRLFSKTNRRLFYLIRGQTRRKFEIRKPIEFVLEQYNEKACSLRILEEISKTMTAYLQEANLDPNSAKNSLFRVICFVSEDNCVHLPNRMNDDLAQFGIGKKAIWIRCDDLYRIVCEVIRDLFTHFLPISFFYRAPVTVFQVEIAEMVMQHSSECHFGLVKTFQQAQFNSDAVYGKLIDLFVKSTRNRFSRICVGEDFFNFGREEAAWVRTAHCGLIQKVKGVCRENRKECVCYEGCYEDVQLNSFREFIIAKTRGEFHVQMLYSNKRFVC